MTLMFDSVKNDRCTALVFISIHKIKVTNDKKTSKKCFFVLLPFGMAVESPASSCWRSLVNTCAGKPRGMTRTPSFSPKHK